jgi:uncharacterized membrane protein YdbT with pleckstrin-like domain
MSRKDRCKQGAGEMRKYQGQKVLYFDYPAMMLANPIRWLIYLVLVFAFGFGLVLYGLWWFECYAKRLLLTEDEVVYIKGVFNTSTTEIRLSDIRSVEVDQSFWGRLVGIGSIKIASAGSDGWEIEINGLPQPTKVRRIINEGRHGTTSSD